MPALLELQRSMRAQLLALQAPPDELLGIYHNTVHSALVNALRLSFPVVQRIVGEEFFEGAAREFIAAHAPDSAYLNDYGLRYPAFLAQFPPAMTLPYLADVADLEWAVNRALHAPDCTPLDLARLTTLTETALPTVSFRAHPSLTLLRPHSPADEIWRAVLAQDSEAMAHIDLTAGPVHLLIERDANGVQVRRLSAAAWQFTTALVAGTALYAALGEAALAEGDINALLAEHLAAGRFIDFSQTGAPAL